MEPFQVFPELVWREIFDKIEDDKDKLSFLRAHSAFRELFEKKHVELGFISALPVLMDYFERDLVRLNRERRESVLSCRLVSRKCSQAVDNWIEFHWENEIDPPRILCKENRFNYTELWTRPQVEKFTKDFGDLSNDRMPVLSRSLNISIPLYEEGRLVADVMNAEQELEDNERTTEILTRIGAHVRALNVDIALSDNPGVDNVENARDLIVTFKSVLEQVPNLKSLTTDWDPIVHPEEMGEILDFPKLPKLIHLRLAPSEIPIDADEHEAVVTDFAPFERYFPQLIHLHLFSLDGWKEDYMEAGRFPKLRHLKLDDVVPGNFKHRRKLLRMCRKLFAPNLETLSAFLRGFTEKERDRITRWIEKWLKMLNKLFKDENVEWAWDGCLGEENRISFVRI